MGNCSCTTNCNPCGPSEAAINQLATKAGAYARQANTYATNAENAWLEFNALYLGAFAVAPTVDNEGNPLQLGALYWNSVLNNLWAWDGLAWVIAIESEIYLGGFSIAPTVDNDGNPLQVGNLYWNTVSNNLFAYNGVAWVLTNFNEFTNFPLSYTTPIPAVDLRTGLEYQIVALGSPATNWTAIGAASATVGERFTKNATTATGNGTARVTRDLNTRFADVVNVKDFGAVGDNVSDDLNAIQDAINYSQSIGGAIVFFPPGTYKISGTITINNPTFGVTLRGSGAAFSSNIVSTNPTGTMIEIQSDQVQLENLSIYRNVFCAIGSGAYNVWFNGAVQCKMQDCRVQGGLVSVLVGGNSADNLFLRNTFTFCTGSQIVRVQESGAIHFIACTFNQQYPGALVPTSSNYSALTWTPSTAYVTGSVIQNGNYFFSCTQAGTSSASLPTQFSLPNIPWYLVDINDGSAKWQLMARTDYNGISFGSKTEYCTIRQCDFTGCFLNAIEILNDLATGKPTAINIENCTAHGPIVNGLFIEDSKEITINNFNTWNPTSGAPGVIPSFPNTSGIVVGLLTESVQIIGSQCYGYQYGLWIASTGVQFAKSVVTSNNFTANQIGIRVNDSVQNFLICDNYLGLGPRGANVVNSIQIGGASCTNYIISNNIIAGSPAISDLGVAPKSVTSNI